MQQSDIEITAGCNEQNLVWNNWLFELQPAVMLQIGASNFVRLQSAVTSTTSSYDALKFEIEEFTRRTN